MRFDLRALRVRGLRSLSFLTVALAISSTGLALPIAGTITIQPVNVNPSAGPAVTPNIGQDLQYSQAIYSQIGMSVKFLPPITLTQDSPEANKALWTTTDFNANLNAGLNLNNQLNTAYAAANGGSNLPAAAIPLYYVTTLQTGAGKALAGVTLSQEDVPAGKTVGLMVQNNPNIDTVPHEVDHLLMNTWRFRAGTAATATNNVHSNNPNDLMALSSVRNIPTSLNPAAPANQVPAPVGTVDTIGIDANNQPAFGWINPPPTPAGQAKPNQVQYVMPQINAIYGASDAGGTAVNNLVTGQKAVNITLTGGNTAVTPFAWGSTVQFPVTDASGPIGVNLIANETARILSATTATAPEIDQFAFEFRDPTGFIGGGGMLRLTESGLANLGGLPAYQNIVPNSLSLWEANYNLTTGNSPPDNVANPVQLAANTYNASVTASGGTINWQANVNFSALVNNTDLFVEFNAIVPEPASVALLAVAGLGLLRTRRRTR